MYLPDPAIIVSFKCRPVAGIFPGLAAVSGCLGIAGKGSGQMAWLGKSHPAFQPGNGTAATGFCLAHADLTHCVSTTGTKMPRNIRGIFVLNDRKTLPLSEEITQPQATTPVLTHRCTFAATHLTGNLPVALRRCPFQTGAILDRAAGAIIIETVVVDLDLIGFHKLMIRPLSTGWAPASYRCRG